MDAILLSGGDGARLGGAEKAFLDLGGETLLARKLTVLRELFENVIIATNAPERYRGAGALVVADDEEGKGPLMGIYCGLRASGAAHCFVTASDTPFLLPAVAEHLAAHAEGFDAVVPVWQGRAEPLCAVYSSRCIPAIAARGGAGRVRSFFDDVRVHYAGQEELERLDPEGLSFFNINTPADYESAKELARAQGGRCG